MIKVSSNLERMLATKVAEGLGFNDNLARDAGIGALGGAGLGALIQAIRGQSVLKGLGLGALGGGLGGAGYNYLSGTGSNPFNNPPVMESQGPAETRPLMPEAAYDQGPFFADAKPFPAVSEQGRSVGMINALEAADRIERENIADRALGESQENAITFDDIRRITGAETLPPLNLYRP